MTIQVNPKSALLSCALACSLVLAISGTCQAIDFSKLQFDLNNITVQATDQEDFDAPFGGVTHTGAIFFAMDDDSSLAVGIDGNYSVGYNATLQDVQGQIDLVNGAIADGVIQLTVMNTNQTLDSYIFSVLAQSGSVFASSSPASFELFGYLLSGATYDGDLSSPSFGGVDTSLWVNAQPLDGSLLVFKYQPDQSGFDGSVDMDLTASAAIPLPPALWSGVMTLTGLGAWRLVRRLTRTGH